VLQNYRYYIIWRCPSIRFLDFQKVKDAEREKATELFGTYDAPTELAKSIMAVRSKQGPSGIGITPAVNGVQKSKMKFSAKEKQRFEDLVRKATTLSEVQKLEKAYAEGRLPPGVADEDAMEET
jgi:U2 small nuclear ribonucleoprotein A'